MITILLLIMIIMLIMLINTIMLMPCLLLMSTRKETQYRHANESQMATEYTK